MRHAAAAIDEPRRTARVHGSNGDGVARESGGSAMVTYNPEATYEVDVSDVEYRNAAGESWLTWVCRPKGPGPFPALLYVHGGQWSRGDRIGNAWVYEPLAASGIIVFSPDFRQ